MAKRQNKSISSLINRKVDDNMVNKATTAIHKKAKETEKEKTIRVSVDTPHSLYKAAKARALDDDIRSLKDFYLHCVRYYLDQKQ